MRDSPDWRRHLPFAVLVGGGDAQALRLHAALELDVGHHLALRQLRPDLRLRARRGGERGQHGPRARVRACDEPTLLSGERAVVQDDGVPPPPPPAGAQLGLGERLADMARAEDERGDAQGHGDDVRRDYYLIQNRAGQQGWAYRAVGEVGPLWLQGWFA